MKEENRDDFVFGRKLENVNKSRQGKKFLERHKENYQITLPFVNFFEGQN